MRASGRGSGRRRFATLVAFGVLATGVSPGVADPADDDPPTERVGWWDELTPSTPEDDPVAPEPEPVESASAITDDPVESVSAVSLPEPGTVDVTLGGRDERRSAGDLPVQVTAKSAAVDGQTLRVEVLDQQVSSRANVTGFAFRLTGEAGASLTAAADGALPAELSVDYSGFRGLFGAGYADRLQLVALPECALADPLPAGCETGGEVLPVTNDRANDRLVVEVEDLAELQGVMTAMPSTPAEPDRSEDDADGSTTTTTAPSTTTTAPPTSVPDDETTTTTSGDSSGEPADESTTTTTSASSTTSTTEAPSSTTTTTVTPQTPSDDENRTESSAPPGAPVDEPVVLAVTAGPEGEEGSFKATPFALSGDWQVGVGSGEFSWNYDFPVIAPPAGPEVSVSLGYSSGAVDGMVTSKNTQAGQAGLGWGDFADAFIERRYNSCRDDDNPDTSVETSDLCWARDNAWISLNGQSSELVADPDNPGLWRLKADPRWKVEHLTKPGDPEWNTDNDGEHWKVTTPDGVKYWFGLGRGIGGWETGSTWSVPVVGDDAGEPCKGVNDFNWCDQAWRWNLDRVEDPNGNAQIYTYAKEHNHYAAYNGWPGLETTRYVRAGRVTEIQYGRRLEDHNVLPARVRFESAWRCSWLDDPDHGPCPQPSENVPGAEYPDVPLDLVCSTRCTNTSPTFFSSRRYAGLTVEAKVGAKWYPQDSYRLAHTFSDSDPDTTDDAKLFLTGIQRTGQATYEGGSPIKLPATSFLPVALNNRHAPGEGESAMPHWRIGAVVDEFGRQVNVTYDQPHPCQYDPGDPHWDTNTTDCFPQMWAPEGEEPTFRAFNKYVVAKVDVKDTTGGSPTMTTSYAYGDQVASGLPNGAWHHDNDDFVPQAYQSFSEWRGYSDVTVTQGATKSRYRVFRGMNGDRLGMGGYKAVNLSSLDGTVTNIADDNWLSGRIFDEVSLRPNGSQEQGTIHRYQTIVTVDESDSCDGCPLDLLRDARWVAENDTIERLRTPTGAFARKRTQTVYDSTYLFPTQVREHGWTGQSGDERCTRTDYAPNIGAHMLDYSSAQTRYGTLDCTGTQVTRSETAYDEGAVGTAPSRGNQTMSRDQISSSPEAWAITTTTFDAMGRALVVTDPNGRQTTTAYRGTTGYPIAVDVTNQLGHTTRTEFYTPGSTCEPCATMGRQLPVKTIDANGNATTYRYDPLGRVTEVRQPTEQDPGSQASWQFVYDIDKDKAEPSAIRTRRLQDMNGPNGIARYLDSWTIYDSLLRERQIQQMSPSSGRTIVTDTIYDNRGLAVEKNLPEDVAGTPGSVMGPPSGGWDNRTVTAYDHLSRPTREDFYAGDAIERTRSMVYTHISTEMTPPQGGKTLTVQDAFGRAVRAEEHDGDAYQPTIYTYDPADRLMSIVDPADNAITYSYDMAGRRIAMDDPDAGERDYSYDPNGNETSVTDATGAQVHTAYDALNRPIERRKDSATGELLATWSYDATSELGLLDHSTRHDTTGDWVTDIDGYDSRGRPAGTTWTVPAGIDGLSGSYSVEYGYDAADHRTSVTYPSIGGLTAETVTARFNSIGLPEAMAGAESYVYAVGYDGRARPTLMGLGASDEQPFGRGWTYNKNQELSNIQSGAVGGVKVQDLSINYDEAGNVTERTANAGDQQWRECYDYDQRQRLIEAYTTTHETTCASDANKGTGPEPYNHTYGYSVDGNLKTRTEDGTAIDYTYPASGADSVRPHAPTAVGGDTYAWNANGRQTSRTVDGTAETLNWTPENRLAGIDSPSGDSSFVYDADGNRLLRRTPQGDTLYIEGHEVTVAAGESDATAVRSYDFDSSSVATRDSEGVSYLGDDNLGTVQISVPSGSTSATVRTHQPYGKPRHSGSHATDRGWIGEIEDNATGLTYLNARYYDPATGVFLSPDALFQADQPESLNPYSYAHNSPVVNRDPTGLCTWKYDGMSCGGGERSAWEHNKQLAADKLQVAVEEAIALQGDVDAFLCHGGGCSGSPESIEDLLYEDFACDLLSEPGVPCASHLDALEHLADVAEGGTVVWEFLFGDAVNCITGESVSACVWTVADFLPAGRIAKGIDALKDAIKAGEKLSDAFHSARRAAGVVCSFSGDTKVLMANGTTKPISEIKIGDWVIATDPARGQTSPRKVTAVWAHQDTLIDLRIKGADSITTTEDHLFWNQTDDEWQQAQELTPGDHLVGNDGSLVAVDGLEWTTAATDAAYNLTIDQTHTYFVVVGDDEALVHNDCYIRNASLAGSSHPVTGVPFDKNGFPDFSAWRHPDVKDVRIDLTGSRGGDVRAANKAAGLSGTPEGYVWHHHQDVGLLQLVRKDVHQATGHTGGFSLGGG